MWLPFFFSKNISVYAIFNDQSINNTLTNDIISFKQLDPVFYFRLKSLFASVDKSKFMNGGVHFRNSEWKG